jgi:hypothetical protein
MDLAPQFAVLWTLFRLYVEMKTALSSLTVSRKPKRFYGGAAYLSTTKSRAAC